MKRKVKENEGREERKKDRNGKGRRENEERKKERK